MDKIDKLVETLGARKKGKWWMALCPAHDDRTPSLGMLDDRNGGVFFKCFAGCTHSDVAGAIQDRLGILITQTATEKPLLITPIPNDAPVNAFGLGLEMGTPTDIFPYRSADGDVLMFKCRWDMPEGSKEFRPLTLWKNEEGELEWRFSGMPAPRPILNLDKLAEQTDKPVLIVEGEKTVLSAEKIFSSHVVITWQDGAGTDKIKLADWSPLKDRNVVIWPDADEPGLNVIKPLVRALNDAGARTIQIVQLPEGLPKGWDLADDLIALGRNPEELLASATEAEDPTLARFVMTAAELANLDVPERELIIDPWLPCSGLAMIFAKRGVGKTYLTLSLAIEIAKGNTTFLGHYHVPKSRRVLYIDGELPLAELKVRMRNLCSAPPENLLLISSEQLFRNDERLNIHDEACQQKIDQMLSSLEKQDRRPELIIIDSLSTLSSGVDENDNTALEQLLKWFMELRHQKYSVLMLHHAGKSGEQRGASRREDYLDTSIKLDSPNTDTPHEGAHFVLSFSKVRGNHPRPDEIDCKLEADESGILKWTTQANSNIPARIATLRAIFDTSPNTQKKLCAILKKSKGAISTHCSDLEDKGELSKQDLIITREGELTLAQYYTELNYLRQEDIPF